LGIILRVFRLEVSIYKAYTTNQFQTTFAQKGGDPLVEMTEQQEGKLLRLLSQLHSRILPLYRIPHILSSVYDSIYILHERHAKTTVKCTQANYIMHSWDFNN
jgi:hypothetical protein